ncbi:hypothetical protein E2C01_010137 [Portunus trituberculatus]|uniref:Uncharacterized protein n=1 Tax=Portunus trituberculatus TaxID=210409 RepID=A0A5B7D7U2_PORTR|nr:hypothetical protein [Portunus trituberculatus]
MLETQDTTTALLLPCLQQLCSQLFLLQLTLDIILQGLNLPLSLYQPLQMAGLALLGSLGYH